MADRLWERAESDLCVHIEGTFPDMVVWEHSRRVARLADAIASLPEVSTGRLDRVAITAAALYHDMGWVLQCRAGELTAQELLLRPTPDTLLESAADWAENRLEDIVPAASLRLAARSIRYCNDRQIDVLEAQILSEADNLDHIGPQAVCLMIRKQQAEGKTLDDLVTTWQRQEEYHYWQARIKECFRFPSVRFLAERRWEALRRFMTDLRRSIRLEDLAQIQAASTPKNEAARPTR